jgi:two-component system sensor histidine kinase/response regulator
MKISQKLIGWLLGLLLPLFLIIILVVSQFTQNSLKSSISRELENNSVQVMGYIENIILQQEKNITTWSNLDLLKIAVENSAFVNTVSDFFQNLMDTYPEYYSIVLLDKDGIVTGSSHENFLDRDFGKTIWFKSALEGKLAISRVFSSPLIQKKFSESDGITIAFAAPVAGYQSKAIEGVIVSFFRWKSIYNILTHIEMNETGRMSLLNQEGKIICDSSIPGIFKINSQEDSLSFNWHDNNKQGVIFLTHGKEKEITGYASSPELNSKLPGDWILLTRVHEKKAFSDAHALRKLLLVIVAVGALLIFFVVYLVTNFIITKPLGILSHGAKVIEKGNLAHRIPILSEDELGAFSSYFNSMAKSLQTTFLSIEEKVEQRTLELQESEDRYRTVFEATGTATLIIEEDMTISLMNSTFENLSGYSKEEIENKKSMTEFIHTKDLEQMTKYHLNRIEQSGSAPRNYEFRFIDREGRTKDIYNTVEPIPGTRKIVISLLDITERKKDEQEIGFQKAFFESLIENSPEAIAITDHTGVIKRINSEFTRLFGYRSEEANGKNINSLIAPPDRIEEARDVDRKAAAGKTYRIETVRRRKDGSPVEVSLMGAPIIMDGEIVDQFAIYREISGRKNAEAALRLSEQKYRTILDNLEAGYYELDLKGTITNGSDVAVAIAGGSRNEDFFGKNFAEFCDKENAQTLFEAYHNVYKTGQPAKEIEWKVTMPDGNHIILDGSAALMRNTDGKPIGFRGIIRDVTERKMAELELIKRTHDLGERVKEMNCLYGISKVTELPGINFEQILTKVVNLIPQACQYPENTCARIVFQDTEFKTENFQKTIWSQASNISIDGQDMGVVEVVQLKEIPDMDEGPFLKEERRLLDDIASRVGNIFVRHRAEKALKAAKVEADQANRAKGEFLANMSHEIRTPMNAILGMTHLSLQTELSPKQKDYLAKIKMSANSLLGIINDILDFSKIEAGKLELESIDFKLEEVMNNLAPVVTIKAQGKENLEVLFDMAQNIPRFLKGDPLRLGQILINLTNNAVKFTKEGEIVISSRLDKENGNRVTLEFSVRDTGVGLTQSRIDTLFEAFTQADTSTTRMYGGTGLGLTICRSLVEMMGGKIWVKSEPGQGSTFIFTADFERGEQQDKRVLKPLPELCGMRVLVIDDNSTSREILKGMLESFSFDVSLADSGEQGLNELEKPSKKRSYDLVLMDWKMPGMDGIEASRRIKNHPGLAKIPTIIMVTAYGLEEVMHQANIISLEGFLIKPVSPSVLFDTIMEAFNQEVFEPASPHIPMGKMAEKLKGIRGARVLLVEDNEINQQVACELLEGAGLQVDIACNGKEAIHALKGKEFEVVLMDVQMPVMDGYQATAEIRKQERFKNISIIAMTAHAMTGDHERCLEVGMNDYLSKPVDPDKLFSTLVKWIKPGKRMIPDYLAAKTNRKSSKDSGPFLPDLPGISVKSGLKRVSGNRKLYRNLLGKFHQNHADAAEAIRRALDKNDIETATRLTHTVKGVSGNIGAQELHIAATNLNNALRQGITKTIPALLEVFSESLNQMIHSITHLEHKERNTTSIQQILQADIESVDRNQILSILNELKKFITSDDFRAVKAMETLKKHFPAGMAEDELAELEKNISDYAYKEAAASLANVMNGFNEMQEGSKND